MFRIMKKIVAFDFDGVLCNSTEECMITGYNAWMKYKGKNIFVQKTEDVPSDLAKYFRPLRGLVRTGGQYFILFNSYENGRINNEADFDDACLKYEEEISEYEKLFFLCRNILRDKDVNYWLSLHSSYENVPENMKKVMKSANVYIVTGKDKDSVRTFLYHLGIDIQDSKIYDKNAARNKIGALKKVAQREDKSLAEIIFLDDNINHLMEPKKAGCLVYMAGWGYHSKEQMELAKSKGVPILGLKHWVKMMGL